jgi:hypothetical protein
VVTVYQCVSLLAAFSSEYLCQAHRNVPAPQNICEFRKLGKIKKLAIVRRSVDPDPLDNSKPVIVALLWG